MIFLTVGTQQPFDRLVKAVDAWAAREKRNDFIAQIGRSRWHPRYIDASAFLSPREYDRTFANADAVVAHAGVGTMISALELGIPLLVMPRRFDLGESPSRHQFATAQSFEDHDRILISWDETELPEKLTKLTQMSRHQCAPLQSSTQLLDTIRNFIHNDKQSRAPSRVNLQSPAQDESA